jgi:alpha-galactosidase
MKSVIIGSGSQFTEFFLQEFFKTKEFRGWTLALVDRQPERLKHEVAMARKLNEAVQWDARIEGYADRKEAMQGADFIYTFIAVNQTECWKKEFELANKYGIHPLEACTAGSAGLGMAIRHVPVVLDICADIEQICPNAWLVLENNPLAKLVAAVQRHTRVKHLGYCNGHELVEMALEQILGMSARDPSLLQADPTEREFLVPTGSVQARLAGVNHCAWVLDVRSAATGEDLYPKLRECLNTSASIPDGYRYAAELCKTFGLFPGPADNHISDYLWCTDKAELECFGLEPYPVDKWFGNRDSNAWEKIAASVNDPEAARLFISRRRTGWHSVQIARQMTCGRPSVFPAVNVVNAGTIENLPADVIVEAPAVLAADGIRTQHVGALPGAIAAVCALHAAINNLVADAAATGSREKALQALLIDPFVHSMTIARKLLDDMLQYNSKYSTRFS